MLAIPLWKLYSQLVYIPLHSRFLLATANFEQIMVFPRLITPVGHQIYFQMTSVVYR